MPIQQGRSGKAIIAAIDCTGHGVPGAFMSLLGESYLAQIVHHLEETNPSRILTLLNQRIRKALKQEGGQSRDGMDAALCTWDADERKLYFSGAKNPLIMIQNGELLQIKGDKMCIGGKVTPAEHRYEAHEFDIKTETMCYLFSDGYPDQFGGANAQKFLIKRFKELLLTIHHLPCQEQFDILNTTFQAWVEGHKQTDDVLVIGFRLMP
jgi:serine phosphatase RsbU (regulator of sigma subunit)